MAAHPPLTPVTLTGDRVSLEPLELDHVDALVEAASVDRSTYGWTHVPADRPAMQRYVAGLLADQAAGDVLPFVQTDAASGARLGCTRLMEIRFYAGRPLPDEIEIGGTWLTATAQRTGVNTEAKLLLLGYAFAQLGVWRVAICTDAANARSRAAIERLGASFEGVLRSHRPRTGDSGNPSGPVVPRDSAIYSIIRDEWPAVHAALLARLARSRA